MLFHLVGLSEIHDGQHREDESLQRDHDDVKPGPDQLHQRSTSDGRSFCRPEGLKRKHERDQDEDHLAGIHVAEQPQTQRQGFRDQPDEFKDEINGNSPDAGAPASAV